MNLFRLPPSSFPKHIQQEDTGNRQCQFLIHTLIFDGEKLEIQFSPTSTHPLELKMIVQIKMLFPF